MKSHAQRGYVILKDVQLHEDLAAGAHYHHERYDGKGYPDGLAGENIPWVARIIAVADTFDAMSSTRPYRKKLPEDFIITEIKKCAGTQLDPKVVQKFLELYEAGEFADVFSKL
jgi:energy-coupling factor transport system substrate-specific component